MVCWRQNAPTTHALVEIAGIVRVGVDQAGWISLFLTSTIAVPARALSMAAIDALLR